MVVTSITLGVSGAGAENATVSAGERDLVVVSNLTTQASGNEWLYEFIEANAVTMAYSELSGSYNGIYVLSGADATFDGVQQTLSTVASRTDGRAIDMFVNLHGSPGMLGFHDGWHTSADLGTALAARSDVKGKLRLLYSTACYGGSHAPDFLTGGFRVASGSRGVNTNAAYDYQTVLDSWRDGYTFGDAQGWGNNSHWIWFYDGAASWMVDGTDSFKDVYGDTDATIDSIRL